MRLNQLVLLSALFFAISGALASQEEIAPLKEITIVADAGNPWGDVTVKLTTEEKGDVVNVAAISITTHAGKQIGVPKEALADFDSPCLNTLTITHEVGNDDKPWLYVRIRYGQPLIIRNTAQTSPDLETDFAQAVIAIHDNKVIYRTKDSSIPGTTNIADSSKKIWEAK